MAAKIARDEEQYFWWNPKESNCTLIADEYLEGEEKAVLYSMCSAE